MWHKPIGVRLGATILFALALMLAGSLPVRAAAMSPKPPAIGDKARDFTLGELGGAPLRLAEVNKSGPVVIVMLRGYPGYQCPLCTRQVGEFIESADEFAKLGATVLFVYPGPFDELAARAAEFGKGKDYPAHFTLVLDLRSSATGPLRNAANIAELFVSGAVVAKVASRSGPEQTLKAGDQAPGYKGALAILVDRGTAGAAEIAAACLNESDRASLFGENTFGRAGIQKQFPWLGLDSGFGPLGRPGMTK